MQLILIPLGLLLLLCTSDQHQLFREPSNEYSFQVWFQLAQWFQRRILKTDNAHFDTLGLLFLLCTSDQQKRHNTKYKHENVFINARLN
jgi:hypothetical protein